MAVLLAGCSSGDDNSVPSASSAASPATSAPESTSVESLGEPVDEQLRAELVATLSDAFDEVRSGPVLIEFEMNEDGRESSATIRVDHAAGLVDAVWIQPAGQGSEITTRNVVVDGRAFLKSTDGAAAEQALNFIEIGVQNAAELLDVVYTGYGRIGPSLDRLILLLEQLPFRVVVEGVAPDQRFTVSFDPADVATFYAETGLERMGGHIPDAAMTLTFVLEAGNLVGLEAAGTHFHDGEALEVAAAVSFEVIEPFELEPPPLDG